MNKSTLIALLVMLLASSLTVNACIHPDSAIQIRMTYTADLQQAELRFTNMELMTEAPGIVCSCAFGSYVDAFDSIIYVAFVDSGTNNLYQNFKPWIPTADATNAWNTFTGTGDLSGFVGEVTGDGLTPGDPVEMIIRMNWALLDSALIDSLPAGNVGEVLTDMLDYSTGTAVVPADHLGTWGVYGYPTATVESFTIVVEPQPSHFDSQDGYILSQIANWTDPTDTTSTNLPLFSDGQLEIFPNPASEFVTVKLPESDFNSISLTSFDGKRFAIDYELAGSDAILIPGKDLAPGLYIIEMVTDKKRYRSKVYFD